MGNELFYPFLLSLFFQISSLYSKKLENSLGIAAAIPASYSESEHFGNFMELSARILQPGNLSLELFVSTASNCSYNECDGSQKKPFNNLPRALAAAELKAEIQKEISEINIYLLKVDNSDSAEFFIDESDIENEFPSSRNIFRNFNGILRLGPYFCRRSVIAGCFNETIRPLIHIRVDDLFFVIHKRMELVSLVIDGFEIPWGESIKQPADRRFSICSKEYLNLSLSLGLCDTSTLKLSRVAVRGIALFTLQPYTECSGCAPDSPNLIIKDCNFTSFQSYGSSQSPIFYTALVNATTSFFDVSIINSAFEKLKLFDSLFTKLATSTGPVPLAFPQFQFINSTFSNFTSLFEANENSLGQNYAGILCQGAEQLNLTVERSVIRSHLAKGVNLIYWSADGSAMIKVSVVDALFKETYFDCLLSLKGSGNKTVNLSTSVYLLGSNRLLLGQNVELSVNFCQIKVGVLYDAPIFEIENAQLQVSYLYLAYNLRNSSLFFPSAPVFSVTTSISYADDVIFSGESQFNFTKENIYFKNCILSETISTFFQSLRPVFKLLIEECLFLYNLLGSFSVIRTKAESHVSAWNCTFFGVSAELLLAIEITRDFNFNNNKIMQCHLIGLIDITNFSYDRVFYYNFLSNVILKNTFFSNIFNNTIVYYMTSIEVKIENTLVNETQGYLDRTYIFKLFIKKVTFLNNTFSNLDGVKILTVEKFLDHVSVFQNTYIANIQEILITILTEGRCDIMNFFVENQNPISFPHPNYGIKFDVEKPFSLFFFKLVFINFQTENGIIGIYNDVASNAIYIEKCLFYSNGEDPSSALYLEIQPPERYSLHGQPVLVEQGAHIISCLFISFCVRSSIFAYSGIIAIENSQFLDSQAEAGGAILMNQKTQLFIYNSIAIFCRTPGLGGFIYGYGSLITIVNTKVYNTSGERGGALYIEKAKVFILYSIFDSVRSKGEGALHFYLSTTEIKDTVFLNCSTEASGGAFWGEESLVLFFMVTIKNSRAQIKGAAAYFRKNSLLEIKGLYLDGSQSGLEGNLYLEGRPGRPVLMEQVVCQGSVTQGPGACLSAFDSNLKLVSWTIENNKSPSNNYLTVISSSSNQAPKLVAYIEDLNILKNAFSQSALVFIFVNLTITSGIANLEKTSGVQVLIKTSNVDIALKYFHIFVRPYTLCGRFLTASDFGSFWASFLFFDLGKSCSAFFFDKGDSVSFNNTIIIKGLSDFSDFMGGGGGGAIRAEYVSINIANCHLVDSEAMLGGAIYLEDSNMLIESTIFQRNSAQEGSDIYQLTTDFDSNLDVRSGEISIVDSVFSSSNTSSIYLISASSFYFLNNSMTQSKHNNNERDTQALKLQNIQNLTLINVKVSYFGRRSAIEIENQINMCTLKMANLTIRECSSKGSGGAIRITVIELKGLLEGSYFYKNYAGENGGALFFLCVYKNCVFEIKNNLFKKNTALLEGNVAKFDGFDGDLRESNSIISESVFQIKQSLFSYPYEFRFSSSNSLNGSFSKNFSKFEFLASGQSINFSCLLYDTFGQSLERSSDGVLKITKDKNSNESINFENSQAYFVNGIASFYDFIVIAQPGAEYKVSMVYIDRKNQVSLQKQIRLFLRKCVRGEVYSGTVCLKCASSSFSLEQEPIANNKSLCDPCPKNAICPGGDLLLPLPGFWRKDEFQVTVVKCPIAEACPFAPTETKFNAKCEVGYYGNLCSNCEDYYRKSGGKCIYGVTWLVVFLYVIMLLVSCALIAYQTVFAFSVSEAECKRRSLFKILVDHFSYMNFISRLDINWSSFVNYLFDISEKFINTVPSDIIDFHWILMGKVEKENVFVTNRILVAISPLFFLVISLAFLYLFSLGVQVLHTLKLDIKALHRRDSASPSSSRMMFTFRWKKDLLALFLVIIYNYSPRMIINALQFLKCIHIDDSGSEYLQENPDIICWGENHTIILYAKVLPSLLLWVVVIPLFLIVFTVRMHKDSGKSNHLKTYSYLHKYLTIDYVEQRYYWEGMIYLSKFAIAICFIITSGLDTKSQGAILILLFLFLFLLQERISPYRFPMVNGFKTSSYIVIILTIALTILASSEKLGPMQKNMYLGLLLMLNGIFYCTWIVFFIKQTMGKKFVRIINRIAGSVVKNSLVRPTRNLGSSKNLK